MIPICTFKAFMKINSIKFKGHRCFKDHWVGFDIVKPITIIIGRNNSGKSHLLDLVRKCCDFSMSLENTQFRGTAILDEESLRLVFKENQRRINTHSLNDWLSHGKQFVGQEIEWDLTNNKGIENLRTTQSGYINPQNKHRFYNEYLVRVSNLAQGAYSEMDKKQFRHLLADRDLTPEVANTEMKLSDNGQGATNIIRRFLLSTDPDLPRNLIQDELLKSLNKIFGEDGEFTELTVQERDNEDNKWEIYFGEKQKENIIPLSNSGSGLKTVILVLLNLLVIPHIEKKDSSEYVFAFEELENNLHPALLRRLFLFIEHYSKEHKTKFFLTTHSSVALDFFGLSESAQIVHVKHDGKSASSSVIEAHFDKVGVISELGAKPSDLLQANGIIWVEGPSDRIYINRWIELFSEGELEEGRDYQCAFYGGSLLAQAEFKSPEEKESEQNRINLLRVNSNIFLICDGDRSGPSSRIKARAKRISGEVKKIPGAGFWATQGREIENYLPGTVIAKARNSSTVPDPGQYESFFPRQKKENDSFIEKHLGCKTLDKTQFAVDCVKHMTFDNMKTRFDWEKKVSQIVDAIRKWNS